MAQWARESVLIKHQQTCEPAVTMLIAQPIWEFQLRSEFRSGAAPPPHRHWKLHYVDFTRMLSRYLWDSVGSLREKM